MAKARSLSDDASGSRADRNRLIAAYAGAHFGKSLFWYASESLFAFFLTEVAHLAPQTTGWVLAGGFLLSGALDVAIGSALGPRLATARSAGRLQFLGTLGSAVCMVLLFAIPAMGAAIALPAACILIALFRLAYAFVDIPQNALLSLAIADDRARAALAAARLAASGVAALAIAAAVSSTVYGDPASRPGRLVIAALSMAAVAIATAWGLARQTARHAATQGGDAVPATHAGRSRTGLPAGAWALLGLMVLANFAAPVFTKLVPYYAAFHLLDPVRGSSAITLVSVGMVLGQPLWLVLLRSRSSMDRIFTTALATAASAALFGFAGAAFAALLLPAAFLFGASTGGLGTTLWAAYGNVIAAAGKGREGFAFGAFTAAAKLALAIGIAGIGILLSDPAFRTAGDSRLLIGMTLPSIVAGLLIGLAVSALRPRPAPMPA